MKQKSNDVFIIIVNWNRKNDTLECLQSLANSEFVSFQVVLVDNASSDGTIEAVQKKYPKTHIVSNEINLGFATGSNQGVKYALERGADWVLLLNNDTIIAQDFLTELLKAGKLNPNAGIFAPKIYYYHQPTTIWSAGSRSHRFPSGRITLIGLGQPDSPIYSCQLPLDYAIGCAMLIKREVFLNIGLLDEQFFMFFEDYDFCQRASIGMYNILFVPTAKMWHKDGASTRNNPNQRWVYMGQSTVFFYKKHFRLWWYSLGWYVLWVISREIINGNYNIVRAYAHGIYQGVTETKQVEKSSTNKYDI